MNKEAEKCVPLIDETDNEQEENADELSSYEIMSFPSDMPLSVYALKFKQGDLKMPEFQRNYVWTISEASKLIESFLLGLPVPGVFLYKEKKEKKLLVIDGQQRILSIIKYMDGIFNGNEFKLRNVSHKWSGKRFKDLDEPERRDFENAILRATIINQLDPEDNTSIYHIFERLNTGGRKLNPMEVRRCIYSGKFQTILESLNKTPSWRSLIGRDEIDIRYRDVEWILRILALADNYEYYEKPMKKFLTNFMISNKNNLTDTVKEYVDIFPDICNFLLKYLGEKPFHLKGKLNYAAMDSIFAIALRLGISGIPRNLFLIYEKIKENKEFKDNVSANTSDKNSVKIRLQVVKDFFLSGDAING